MLIRSAGILTDAFCSALLPYLPALCTEEKEGDEVFRENALTRKTNVHVRQKNTFLKKCPRYTEKVVEKWRIIYYYNGSCLA